MRKLAMHWWILIGLVAGVVYGYLAAVTGTTAHVLAYIQPFGTLFLNLLKMIAVPLVLFSLVAGVASLNDSSKLSRIGGKSIALYLGTTVVAITIGLLFVNLFGPGTGLAAATREKLMAAYGDVASERAATASGLSLLEQLVAIVPTNPFGALAEAQMLQVVFFALMVAPSGSTKLATSLSTPRSCSTQRTVTGNVAALELELNASSWAGAMARAKRRSGTLVNSRSRAP